MIEFVKQDLTKAPERYIVHGCNGQYKMGSGVALAIRKAFPDAYHTYMRADRLQPGTAIAVETKGKIIGNLITQEYYGYGGERYAEPMWIELSLSDYIQQINMHDNPLNIKTKLTIASSRIGCSLGGLKWDEVGPVYDRISSKYNVTFKIYEI